MPDEQFTWRDAERTVHFRAEVIGDSPEILAEHGFATYELLTTERAMGAAPLALAEDSACFHHVPRGQVHEVAARLIDDVGDGDLVALGGGRVIDVAKALAAVRGTQVAALPTTLSGAEMTRIHRLPAEHEPVAGLVRPAVVLADPPVMVTLPEERLRASATNALAHGADSLWAPLANPVAELAALRGAELIGKALAVDRDRRPPSTLALGSILCAYAIDSAGLSLHHVLCQSLVRTMRLPHAETNAAMLPHVLRAMRRRVPDRIAALADALGTTPGRLATKVERLGGGKRRLAALGAERSELDRAVKAIIARPELELTPDPPAEAEVRELVEAAW